MIHFIELIKACSSNMKKLPFFNRLICNTTFSSIPEQFCEISKNYREHPVIVVYLHEESRHQSLTNVDVVVSTGEVCAGPPEVEAVHDACKLLSNVVSTLQRSVVDEVVIAPLRIFMVWKITQKYNIISKACFIGKSFDKKTLTYPYWSTVKTFCTEWKPY